MACEKEKREEFTRKKTLLRHLFNFRGFLHGVLSSFSFILGKGRGGKSKATSCAA